MRFKFLNSILVSASMLSAVPAVAAPVSTPAAKLSVAGARTGATVQGEKLAGGASIIALILVGGIVAIGVLAATQDDSPSSN